MVIHDFVEFRDGYLRWKFKPSKRVRVGDICGTMNCGYLRLIFQDRSYYCHVICYEKYKGDIPEGMEVDHIDHNRTNNHPDNLRLVTKGENLKNKSLYRANKTGYPGVYLRNGRYEVSKSSGGKRYHVGVFYDLDEAILASKQARDSLGYHNNHGK